MAECNYQLRPARLPADVTRCHDHDCEQHEDCARWLMRTDDGYRVPHAHTLRGAP